MTVDLPALATKIQSIGDKIKEIKTSGDGGDVAPLVTELLAAKQEYADNKGGLGVDGKPYEPPLSKAEKKKRAKAEKAAKAAAEGSGGKDVSGIVFVLKGIVYFYFHC